LILTAQCNLRCSYCYQNAKGARSMSWDTLQASIDLALQSPSPRVELTFTGGEPLLELELIRRGVAHAQSRALEEALRMRRIPYRIVGEDESDIKQGLISISSPVAKALIGHRIGDEVQIKVPSGIRIYEIIDIKYL